MNPLANNEAVTLCESYHIHENNIFFKSALCHVCKSGLRLVEGAACAWSVGNLQELRMPNFVLCPHVLADTIRRTNGDC